MQHEAIIIDTETSDTDEPDVLELAFAPGDCGGITGGAQSFRFKPAKPIAWGALATHHILPEDLEGCEPSATALGRVPQAQYWIGHNVDFDWKVLGRPQVFRICTLAMCRSIWPKCDSHTLVAMTYFLEGANAATREKVQGAHGAASDIGLCADILARIARDEGITTLRDLWGFSEECRIPKIMSFGKFKGEPISAVDRGWANWYQRQPDTDEYLIEALRRARKL